MRYLVTILFCALLNLEIFAADYSDHFHTAMSRGRGSGTAGRTYHSAESPSAAPRQAQAFYRSEHNGTVWYQPQLDEEGMESYMQACHARELAQTVHASVHFLSVNPILHGTYEEWHTLSAMLGGCTHNPYSHYNSRPDRAYMLVMAQNLSRHNWRALVSALRDSINAVNRMASSSRYYENWSWARTHLINASDTLHQGIQAIIANIHANAGARNAEDNDSTTTTTAAVMQETSLSTPSSKEEVLVQDAATQTDDISASIQDAVTQTDDISAPAEPQHVLPLAATKDDKTKKPVPAVKPAAKLSATDKAQQEAERQKAALAKVLQEVQSNSAKVTEKTQSVRSAKEQLQALLAKAVTENQVELKQIVAEFDALLKRLAKTQEAINKASSKDSKQLHELKKNTSSVLSAVDEAILLMPGFLSRMEKAVANARFKPAVLALTARGKDLARLKAVCTYEPLERFVALGAPAGNSYHTVIDALQGLIDAFVKNPSVDALSNLAKALDEHRTKSRGYYKAQKTVIVSNSEFNLEIIDKATQWYKSHNVYPEFLECGDQKIKFVSLKHYQSVVDMLTQQLNQLETSHAEWLRYSDKLMKTSQDMEAIIKS